MTTYLEELREGYRLPRIARAVREKREQFFAPGDDRSFQLPTAPAPAPVPGSEGVPGPLPPQTASSYALPPGPMPGKVAGPMVAAVPEAITRSVGSAGEPSFSGQGPVVEGTGAPFSGSTPPISATVQERAQPQPILPHQFSEEGRRLRNLRMQTKQDTAQALAAARRATRRGGRGAGKLAMVAASGTPTAELVEQTRGPRVANAAGPRTRDLLEAQKIGLDTQLRRAEAERKAREFEVEQGMAQQRLALEQQRGQRAQREAAATDMDWLMNQGGVPPELRDIVGANLEQGMSRSQVLGAVEAAKARLQESRPDLIEDLREDPQSEEYQKALAALRTELTGAQ